MGSGPAGRRRALLFMFGLCNEKEFRQVVLMLQQLIRFSVYVQLPPVEAQRKGE